MEEIIPLEHFNDPVLSVNMGMEAWSRIMSPAVAGILNNRFGISNRRSGDQGKKHVLCGSHEAEIMVTSWGARQLDNRMLEKFPKLQLVIHGAGSIKAVATPEAIAKGIRFSTGSHVNAQPVAEYCLGVILWDLKRISRYREKFDKATDLNEAWWGTHKDFDGGYYHKKIGLIGWGAIARCLAGLLRHFDMDVHVFSKHLTDREIRDYRLTATSQEWIMENCDVISLHSADTPANKHMINSSNLKLMKPGSSLINTARGGIVDEEALAAKLGEGSIWAYLDVAQEEPPPAGHPFYNLPNCILTPHVSGSIGTEALRLGDFCLRELENFRAGKPLENEMNLEQLPERA